jgi:hypothetical protein
MKHIEILLQGEAIPDILVVRLERDKLVKDLLAAAAEHRTVECLGEFQVFTEDGKEPLAPESPLPAAEHGHPIRMHVHRCNQVEAIVTFNGVKKEHQFGPGATVATVKQWAAIKAFSMTPADAAEHVLQLAGTSERPEPDTHIGTLTKYPDCRVKFDLVPLKRVEG